MDDSLRELINSVAEECSQVDEFPIRDIVPGRVLHIDADFLAYQVSAHDDVSISEMKNNCDTMILRLKLMSGADKTILHLTPKGSNKGFRFDVAVLKEYQGNRKDKPKPAYLHVIREWMHRERGAILHENAEADDGLATAQYKAIAEGNKQLSIIGTKDKDLLQVPGLMLDWDTGDISDITEDYGHIQLVQKGSGAKKVTGRGWKFFWAQVLMGDTADNISGLPLCCDPAFCKSKPKKVGPVLTFDILEPIETNWEAYQKVKSLYQMYGEQIGFVNWRDQSKVSWQQALSSEMMLLWMRRCEDPADVINWLLEEKKKHEAQGSN